MSAIKITPIVFNFSHRKLFCDDRVADLSGKRVAAFVHCLISCFLKNQQLSKQNLALALEANEPGLHLDRTALKRLVEKADQALREVTGSAHQRLSYPARGLTTGPWNLVALPDEEWAIENHPPVTRPIDADPALTQCKDALLGYAVANNLAVIDAQIQLGQHKEAVQLMAAQIQSSALSDEMHCLLGLRLVRALRSSAGEADTSVLLAAIAQRADKLPKRLKTYFSGEVAMFEARGVFNQSPVKAAFEIDFSKLRLQLDSCPNTSTQWEWCNLKALTLRRRIEKQLRTHTARPLIEKLALEIITLFSAAYFWTLVAKTPYCSQVVACNYAYNLHWLYSRGLHPNLDASIAWFKLAFTLVDKFDLPQDSAWDFLMLGDIYLSSSEAKNLIGQDALAWPEHANPAKKSFYLRALDIALSYGDARQQITALNQVISFLQLHGQHAHRLSFVNQRDSLVQQHHDVHAEMLKDGFVLA